MLSYIGHVSSCVKQDQQKKRHTCRAEFQLSRSTTAHVRQVCHSPWRITRGQNGTKKTHSHTSTPALPNTHIHTDAHTYRHKTDTLIHMCTFMPEGQGTDYTARTRTPAWLRPCTCCAPSSPPAEVAESRSRLNPGLVQEEAWDGSDRRDHRGAVVSRVKTQRQIYILTYLSGGNDGRLLGLPTDIDALFL